MSVLLPVARRVKARDAIGLGICAQHVGGPARIDWQLREAYNASVANSRGFQMVRGFLAGMRSQLPLLIYTAASRAISTVLYRDYYDVGPTLQRFSQEFATLRDQEGVVSLLLDGLADTLNLTGIAFISLPEGLDERMLSLIEAEDIQARRQYASPEGRAAILRGLAGLNLDAHRLSSSPLLLDPWPGCAGLLLIGPAAGSEAMAMLVIGRKRTGGRLRHDDRTLLVTVAHQAATALANAVLVAGLRTSLAQVEVSTAQLMAARAEQRLLLRELVDADERQRAALARDLHDDALQEVLYLIRHSRLCSELAAALNLAVVSPVDLGTGDSASSRVMPVARLQHEVGQLVERSVVVERKLRALYMGLYPALLNLLGLPAALDDLAGELSRNSALPITVEYDDAVIVATATLDSETSLHIYRVAQEALNNVTKHAGASSAVVRLCLALAVPEIAPSRRPRPRTTLRLDVQDDGRGLPLPIDYVALLLEGHLGLAGMRERAERVGGQLTVTASPSGGTWVSLHVPLDVAATMAGERLG